MKIAIFSDIHGNVGALELALKDMQCHAPDQYLFLGDLCGYYYETIECWNLLTEITNLVSVLGNHDRIFLDILEGNKPLREEYKAKYGLSMEKLLEKNYNGLASWLYNLKEIALFNELRIMACHGSPIKPLVGYIYPDTNFTEYCEEGWVLIAGHTHHRMNRKQSGIMAINPGSIGQPRDGKKPSWCLFDTQTNEAKFFSIDFDSTNMLSQIMSMRETNPYLSSILLRQEENIE